MKIKWLGHASVLITSESGIEIVTDPFEPGPHAAPGGCLDYASVQEPADIILVSHEHPDHNYISTVPGNPAVVRGKELKGKGTVTVKGIGFRSVPTFHDASEGKVLGENAMVCFQVDGIKICHTGDLGHTLSDKQIAELGPIDVLLLCVGLLVPVGEKHYIMHENGKKEPFWDNYIVNADVPNKLYEQISSKVIIPIHFGNEKCTFKLVPVDQYLKGKKNVVRMNTSEVELKGNLLPRDTQIIVLKPAL